MSEIKVNKISPRTACGTTTLGDSGDTFTIPAGVSITNSGTASGFGATGAASWNTTVKTSTFTAVDGEGYFVNTTSGPITVNLPAGAAGAVVAVKDYAGTFDTNNCTIAANGSDKIGGTTTDAVLSEEGIAVTLVFIDSTQGWLVTDSGLQSEAPKPSYIAATGGTVTTVCTNFKVHTFTGPGTFCVSAVGNAQGSNTVSYMVVAGGAGSGANAGGGGGAGGFRESKAASDSYTASPLNATSGPTYNLPVTATGFPITVGAGGAGSTCVNNKGVSGSDSTFSTITSAGGGGGGSGSTMPGNSGGSGGGARANQGGTGGTGNTPPVSPSQGNNGGNTAPSPTPAPYVGGGGGGATAVGATGNPGDGSGGAGATTNINGSPTAFAGGGGGASNGPPTQPGGAGGTGGGGSAAVPGNSGGGTPGTVNTGGGGGGNGAGYSPNVGLAGGSGIVIIRYKFQ